MLINLKRILIFVLPALLLLSACNLPTNGTPTQSVPGLVYTVAAQTVAAQFTQAARGTPIPTQPVATQPIPTQPQNTPGQPSGQATNTPLPPTATPFPTQTPLPPTATPLPCNLAGFVKDVTVPDDTQFAPGTTFNKTWRIKNIGSCTWTSGYNIVFDSGDSMGAAAATQLTNGTIPPNSEADVSIQNLTAPNAAGSYQGFFKLRDASGNVFGLGGANKSFWVKIKVTSPVSYDFMAKANNAVWKNATTVLPFLDPKEDAPGVAVIVSNPVLEDNKTYSQALATYPQRIDNGLIMGTFSAYTIQDGDHFKATIGFRRNCNGAHVKFRLNYTDGSTTTTVKEWDKSCDGNLLVVDADLSSLKTKSLSFILEVVAVGQNKNDFSMWINPRIQK